MSNRLILFALLSVAMLSVKAQGLSVVKDAIDCGQVKFRSPVTVAFEIKNSSGNEIKISDVLADCGCVSVDYPHNRIEGNSSFSVNVTFDAKQMGHFEKQVGVYEDNSDKPLILKLKGDVVEKVVNLATDYPFQVGDVRVDKNDIEFDDANRGDVLTQRIHIMNVGTKSIQPMLMHLPNYLSASVSPSIITPGHAGVATITLDSHKLRDFGLTQTSIYLGMFPGDNVSDDKEIGVSAVLLPGFSSQNFTPQNAPKIKLSSTELNLGADGNANEGVGNVINRVRSFSDKILKGDNTKTGYISIENTGKSTLDIRRLQIFTSGLSVSLNKTKIKPGDTARLRIKADMDELSKARRRPRVLMITNDPENPKIVIVVNVK